MPRQVINELNQIKSKAFNHQGIPDELIRTITHVCHSLFNIGDFYSEFGIITKRDALDLLSNNIIAAERQHDLADAEYFREQKNQFNGLHGYFTETIHGCHIAPTITPVMYQDVIDIINKIYKKIINSR